MIGGLSLIVTVLLTGGALLRAADDTETTGEGSEPVPTVFDQPAYPGITVLSKEKGNEPWQEAIPEHWRQLQQINAGLAGQIETPLYTYPDEQPPTTQNVYRDSQALKYDDGRCVAVSMLTRGVGDTAEGFLDYKMWYKVSTDGGQTYDEERPIVEEGEQYSPMHPTRHVWIGKNSFCWGMIPATLRMSNGEIIMPCQLAPLDARFRYYNPTGRFTFSMVVMVIGRWNEAGDDIIWESSEKILPSAEQSYRGFDESAVIELGTPGHILCVLRAGDGYQWKALSVDYGKTWSAHDHLTYSDGEEFWTPSSCMALHRHSRTGKVYWIGNISRVDSQGSNNPRYPLMIAEVDEDALALRKETVTIIDDKGPGDPETLALSNFRVVEDAETGHMVVTVNRWVPGEPPEGMDSGVHTYVIAVE